MGQEEDTEKELSFECLRTVVDEAIKTKNICIIERIEQENIRYAQKYAELLVSKKESKISFESYFIGVDSIAFAILGLGLSYLLFIASMILKPGIMTTIAIITFFIIGIVLAFGATQLLRRKPKQIKEFENINKDIEFIHLIILKIEEMLSNRTSIQSHLDRTVDRT